MILAGKNHDAELMALAPSIKRYMNEWQIVHIKVVERSPLSQGEIIQGVLKNYEKYEGLIYPVSPMKIIMIVRLGIMHNYAVMKAEIEDKLPKHCCRIMLKKMNAAGMGQVQIDLVEKGDSIMLSDSMYYQRQKRKENVFLVVDDDNFVRMSMSKMLALSGTAIEAADGGKVLSQYLKHNPDMVFLDIHMPGKSGIELIHEILEVDQDAFIIILSADSSADNVMRSLEEGAAGFLSKPPSKEKVKEYIGQCITMK